MATTPQTNAASAPQPIATPQVQNQTAPATTTTTTTTTTAPPVSATPAPAPTQPAAAPVSAQGLTAQQMGQYAEQRAAQAATERKEAEIQKVVAARPQGTAYDPATGTYKDPLAGTTYVGATTGKLDAQGREILTAAPQSPTAGLRFEEGTANAVRPTGIAPPIPPPAHTPILNETTKSTINSGLYGDAESGILSTKEYTLARNDLGNVIKQAEGTPLARALTESESYARSVIEANRAEYNRLQGVLAGSGDDPVAQLFAKRQMRIAEQMQAAVADIHAQADASLKKQEKANVEMMGKAKAALNAAGQVGSMVGEGYLAAQLQNNLDALESIKASERKAVNDARIAFENQQDDLAFKQAELIERRRKEANDLLSKNYEIATQMEQMGMQRQQFATQAKSQEMQMRREGRAAANDFLSAYAKQGFSTEIIPDSVWDTAVQESGGTISREVAKVLYSGSLKDQNAKNAEDYAKNLQNFYNAARLLDPKDTATILNRPNLDGSFTQIKRADVRMAPDYEAFEITEGGKKYRAYVDKNDPEGKMRKILIGDDDPHYQYFEDDDGIKYQFDERTGVTKTVFDPAGNPGVIKTIMNVEDEIADKPHESQTRYNYNNKKGDFGAFKNGLAKQESGGNYKAIGPKTAKGDRAYGKYQVMGANIPSWTQAALGKKMTPTEFLNDPTAQEKVADWKMGALFDKYGNWGDVASIWFSGRPLQGNTASDVTGTSTPRYVRNVLHNMGQDKPKLDEPHVPQDNATSWKIEVKPGTKIATKIGSGTVTSVDQVGTYTDGTPMWSVTVKDHETNTVRVISGIRNTELVEGSSWGQSAESPSIGEAGQGGYTTEVRNSDNSPVQPTGITDLEKYGSWGERSSPPRKRQQEYEVKMERIRNDIETGRLDLDRAVKQVKNDPLLSQIHSDIVLDDLAGRSEVYERNKKEKETQRQEQIQLRVQQNNINIGLKMRDDFNKHKDVAAYQTIQQQQKVIETAMSSIKEKMMQQGKNFRITGEDQAIIMAFNKFLDSNSTVREGEYARSEQGQNIRDQITGKLGSLANTGGAGLTYENLQGISNLIEDMFIGYKDLYDRQVISQLDAARYAQVNPGLVVGSENLRPVSAIGPDGGYYEIPSNDPRYLEAFLDGRISYLDE